MEKIILLFAIAGCAAAGSVYIAEYQYQADLNVYVTGRCRCLGVRLRIPGGR